MFPVTVTVSVLTQPWWAPLLWLYLYSHNLGEFLYCDRTCICTYSTLVSTFTVTVCVCVLTQPWWVPLLWLCICTHSTMVSTFTVNVCICTHLTPVSTFILTVSGSVLTRPWWVALTICVSVLTQPRLVLYLTFDFTYMYLSTLSVVIYLYWLKPDEYLHLDYACT